MSIRTVFLALFLLLPPWFVGCAGDTGPGGGGPGVVDGARLEVVGSASRILDEYAEEAIEVRYLSAEGNPISGTVEFFVEGDPAGGTLSGHSARTDADGVASITLRTGTQANFDVVATAELAQDPARVGIQVQPLSFGSLDYVVTYTGLRVVDSAEVALFSNITCSDLDRSVPSPAQVGYAFLRARETFDNVEVGVPMAVYALGIDRNDNVAAEACADVTLSGPTGNVEINLADVGELFGGTYSVEETFDVTAGFSPALDFTLDLLTGLATDPARWLVDYVAGSDSVPSWLRSALSSRVTRDLVANALRNAIDDIHVPGYVSDLFDLGHGIDTAFTQLTLDGELTFGEGTEFGTYDGTHLVTGIHFPLVGGGEANRSIRALANLTVEVGPTITMHEHTLAIPFGQVVEMVLNEVLLPALPGSPSSTHELLTQLLDCSSIASSLAGEDATVESIANGVCDVGLTVLSGVIENYVTEMWQYDSLTLSGTADLVDTDTDYDRDHLEDGRADATWSGDSGDMMFTGTLAGARLDDMPGRTNPVRERINGLR